MSKEKAPLKKPNLKKLDQFAKEVEQREVVPETKIQKPKQYPWESKKVRADVIKGMGVPLTERHLLKLRFIARHSRLSQRRFCQVKLEEAIDREIRAMIKEIKPD